MKFLILLLTSVAAFGQIARPTYNPFNSGGMIMPQYQQPQFNNGFNFPNNTNHPLNFHRPNAFGFQNNFQRPQQQFFPQSQPQQNWQHPQMQSQQPQAQPVPLFTRRFHLNNGYLFGRPTLYLDPKTGKMQPWVRKNLR